jgi:hypothetical protein
VGLLRRGGDDDLGYQHIRFLISYHFVSVKSYALMKSSQIVHLSRNEILDLELELQRKYIHCQYLQGKYITKVKDQYLSRYKRNK